ncbi:PIG-P-domain-containing protein [Phaeosphaeriaceae sp. SRC1lsM3a]|nr:PIG-P-domain-containing protein [Stagonospora sp. SRC1lsM3a]
MSARRKGKNAPARLQSRSTPNLHTLQSRTNGKHEDREGREGQVNGEGLLDVEDTESDDEEEYEGEEQKRLSLPRPLHASRSHSQLPQQPTGALFPPFYNRPPVPIPPSPSLTSLLRPSFASRPTTPDSSDIELSSKPSSVRSASNLSASARHAPRIPRAAPKVPTYEYYGFAMYLGSSAAFLVYILWAYVPAPMLHQMGVYYYPNRWWALAIPCWLIALIIYIYVALAAYNTGYLTLKMDSLENLVDECAQVAVVNREAGGITGRVDGSGELDKYRFGAEEDANWRGFWSTGTDAVMDVPIGGVCEVLYGDD